MADQHALYLKFEALQGASNIKNPQDILSKISESQQVFTENVDMQRLRSNHPPTVPEGFTGTWSRKISVLITKALDISQPLAKNEAKQDGEDSEGGEGNSDDEFGGD